MGLSNVTTLDIVQLFTSIISIKFDISHDYDFSFFRDLTMVSFYFLIIP